MEEVGGSNPPGPTIPPRASHFQYVYPRIPDGLDNLLACIGRRWLNAFAWQALSPVFMEPAETFGTVCTGALKIELAEG